MMEWLGNFIKWFVVGTVIFFVIILIFTISDGSFLNSGFIGGITECAVTAAGASFILDVIKEVGRLSLKLLHAIFEYFG